MKKITLSTLIFSLLFILSRNANAQDYYKTAVGLKFGGYENGVSIKYFTESSVALEGIVGFRSGGVVFSGLYELHQEAFDVPGLKFYYGAGAHIGAIGKGEYKRFGNDEYYNSSHILLGVDGVLGLEYLIPKSPIAVSLDLNPRVELATGPFFDLAPGLGIKYAF